LPKEIVNKPVEIIKLWQWPSTTWIYPRNETGGLLSKYDLMHVAEGAGSLHWGYEVQVDPDRNELDIAYHFESVEIGSHINDFGLVKIQRDFLAPWYWIWPGMAGYFSLIMISPEW
jgi:oligo-1,6-glucosidase